LALAACAGCEDLSPEGGVAVSWRVELGRDGGGWQGLPAALGDRWIGFAFGRARAFDRESGRALWETTLTTRPVGAAQNVAIGGGLAVIAESDTVFALSTADGSVAWRFGASASTDLCEIDVNGGVVYVGTRDHRVYALNLASGAEQWSVDVGAGWTFLGVVTGVARSGDSLYVAVEQWLDVNGSRRRGHVVALRVTDGAELWRSVGAGDLNTVSSAPGVADRLLLLPDLWSGFFAVDRFSGSEVWRFNTAEFAFGALQAPVARDGIAFGAAQGGVYAVDLETGELRWKREDLVGARDVALCGDVLLVQNQTIQVLDPRNGRSFASLLVDPVDFPTSDLAVDGDEAFFIGNVAAYGLTCR
jgi:outer membrane protein assembly factor BamB